MHIVSLFLLLNVIRNSNIQVYFCHLNHEVKLALNKLICDISFTYAS